MADNQKVIMIELGGSKYRFRYKYRGIAFVEAHLGEAFPKIMARFGDAMNIKVDVWVALIYAGLIHDHPEVDIDAVRDEFDYALLPNWAVAITEAMSAAMPQPEAGGAKKPRRATK